METTLVVAKILGIYLVVSGFFLLFRGKTLPAMMKDFFGHPAFVYLTGVILVFLSSLFLIQNNIWDGTWRSVITLIAWATLLKGLGYIFVPEMLHRLVNKNLLGMLNISGVIAFIAGISLFCIR